MSQVYLLDEGAPTQVRGKNSTYEVVWQTSGYSTNVARKAAIQAHGSYLSSVTSDGYTLDYLEWSYERQSKQNYKVRIIYSHKESSRNKTQNTVLQNVGDEETRISFSSINIPISEATSQTAFGNSPDCGNSIEYNTQTQEVKGTTKRKLVSRLVITKLYNSSTVTNSWINARENKLFTVNAGTFRSRPKETVMFVGLEINQRALSGAWQVTFTFEYMPTEEKDLADLDIGATGNQTIYPFRYYWALYEEEKDGTANVLVPKAKGFYEAQIYETSDFSTII